MTAAQLLEELAKREALIVHCSRPGKGDEGIDGLLFPEDLQKAIDLCANRSTELCCSVVWPGHTETFGAVGIILKPRSTKSITSICTTDAGSRYEPAIGKRVGLGSPFSQKGVLDTFANATCYNEWNVQDADTIGIFVHPGEQWEVPKRIPITQIPGYDPAMESMFGGGDVVGAVVADRQVIAAAFPSLPIFSFSGSGIVRVDTTGLVPIKSADLYR